MISILKYYQTDLYVQFGNHISFPSYLGIEMGDKDLNLASILAEISDDDGDTGAVDINNLLRGGMDNDSDDDPADPELVRKGVLLYSVSHIKVV